MRACAHCGAVLAPFRERCTARYCSEDSWREHSEAAQEESYGSASTGTRGPLVVTADNTRCWDTGLKYAWNLPLTLTNTTTGSNPQTSPVGPNPKFDPDLSLLGGGTPPPGDTTAPTAPTNITRDAARTTTSTIWFTWTPSTDNVAVAHYNEYRDGTLVDSAVSPDKATAGDWVGGTLTACTNHTVGLEAVDSAGNVSAYYRDAEYRRMRRADP